MNKDNFEKFNRFHDAAYFEKLQTHVALIKNELVEANRKIRDLEKYSKAQGINQDNFSRRGFQFNEGNFVHGIVSAQKKVQSKFLLLMELLLLPVIFLLLIVSGIDSIVADFIQGEDSFQSKYFVENLRGDTIDTWKSWRLIGSTLNVNVIVPNNLPSEKFEVISNAINSMEAVEIISSNGKEQSSRYYNGWKGAINDANSKIGKTRYQLPLEFNIMQLSGGQGDIIINLSNIKDVDGYTGFTKSIVDGNEILKSFITIYDAKNLTDEELATITRHEFGHALGLGHSTAPEDLMAPTIDMTFPLISECNVLALVDLYNEGEGGKTTCEK